MGLALYPLQADTTTTTCTIYHIRSPDDQTFIFDPRVQPLEDPVRRVRCEIALLTAEQYTRTIEILLQYGNDKGDIPEMEIGNCQDWVASAVSTLEQEGLVQKGEREFWRWMVNQSAEGMKGTCVETGRGWFMGR
ncbi:hypothetical protein BDW74DRAFT_158042 [Aspergillus multicolor]|uniref:uncharacterized protein n=1 Tax=Aspergillus multicolor TaxID=41759 RepID=UPI003CCD405E